MSTQIKRLQQSGIDFVPITLSEAVVVNCKDNIPGLQALGITTLEKVLTAILGLNGINAQDIEQLTQLVNEINTVLSTKQDKLIPGNGIEILPNGVINATFSTTLYEIQSTLPYPPSEEYLNKIYLIPVKEGTNGNVFNEYVCYYNDGNYYWEQLGQITSEINIDEIKSEILGYVSTFTIQAVDIKKSNGEPVEVKYEIPSTLYDTLV